MKKKCKCRKTLVDPLVEECTENIDETKLVRKTLDKNETKLVKKTLDEDKDRCTFCTVYKVLFLIFFIFFIISIGTGIYFVYRKYVNCNINMIYLIKQAYKREKLKN